MTFQEFVEKTLKIDFETYISELLFIKANIVDEEDIAKLEDIITSAPHKTLSEKEQTNLTKLHADFRTLFDAKNTNSLNNSGDLNSRRFIKTFEKHYKFSPHQIRDVLLKQYLQTCLNHNIEQAESIRNVISHQALWPHQTLSHPHRLELIDETVKDFVTYADQLPMAASILKNIFQVPRQVDRQLLEIHLADILTEHLYNVKNPQKNNPDYQGTHSYLQELFQNVQDNGLVKKIIAHIEKHAGGTSQTLPALNALKSKIKLSVPSDSLLYIEALDSKYIKADNSHDIIVTPVSRYQKLHAYLKQENLCKDTFWLKYYLLKIYGQTQEQKEMAATINYRSDSALNLRMTIHKDAGVQDDNTLEATINKFNIVFHKFFKELIASSDYIEKRITYSPLFRSLYKDFNLTQNKLIEALIISYIDTSLKSENIERWTGLQTAVKHSLIYKTHFTNLADVHKVLFAIDNYIRHYRKAGHLLEHFFEISDELTFTQALHSVIALLDRYEHYDTNKVEAAFSQAVYQQFPRQKNDFGQQFLRAFYQFVDENDYNLFPNIKLTLDKESPLLFYQEEQPLYKAVFINKIFDMRPDVFAAGVVKKEATSIKGNLNSVFDEIKKTQSDHRDAIKELFKQTNFEVHTPEKPQTLETDFSDLFQSGSIETNKNNPYKLGNKHLDLSVTGDEEIASPSLKAYIETVLKTSFTDFRSLLVLYQIYDDHSDSSYLHEELLYEMSADTPLNEDKQRAIVTLYQKMQDAFKKAQTSLTQNKTALDTGRFVKFFETYYGFTPNKARDTLLELYLKATSRQNPDHMDDIRPTLYHDALWLHKELKQGHQFTVVDEALNHFFQYAVQLNLSAAIINKYINIPNQIDPILVELHLANLIYNHTWNKYNEDEQGAQKSYQDLQHFFSAIDDQATRNNLIEAITKSGQRLLSKTTEIPLQKISPTFPTNAIFSITSLQKDLVVLTNPKTNNVRYQEVSTDRYTHLRNYLTECGLSYNGFTLNEHFVLAYNQNQEMFQDIANSVLLLTDQGLDHAVSRAYIENPSQSSDDVRKQIIVDLVDLTYDSAEEVFEHYKSSTFPKLSEKYGPLMASLKADLDFPKNDILEALIYKYIDLSLEGNDPLQWQVISINLRTQLLSLVEDAKSWRPVTLRQSKRIQAAIDQYIVDYRIAKHLLDHFFDHSKFFKADSHQKEDIHVLQHIMMDFVDDFRPAYIDIHENQLITMLENTSWSAAEQAAFLTKVQNVVRFHDLNTPLPENKLPLTNNAIFLPELDDYAFEVTEKSEFDVNHYVFIPPFHQNMSANMDTSDKKDDDKDSDVADKKDSEGPQSCLTDVNIPPVSKDIFRIVPVTPEERLADYNRQLLEQRKAQADQALQELLQQRYMRGQQYFIYAPQITQPHHIPVMNSQQLHLGQNNMVTLRATGTDAFTTTQSTSRGTGSSTKPQFRIVRSTPIVDSQAPIFRGPGSVHPVLSTGGKVAGAYIGVFMMAPQIYKDSKVILSPRTTKAQKGAAVFDLTKMGVGVWAFGKFVMKKHPQVGAGIMMGTAAYHGAESIEHYLLRPYLQKAEFGQTGQKMIFTNEQDYFNSRPLGPSCTDGRQVLFLQPLQTVDKKLYTPLWKK